MDEDLWLTSAEVRMSLVPALIFNLTSDFKVLYLLNDNSKLSYVFIFMFLLTSALK